MREHATLRRDVELVHDLVNLVQQAGHILDIVGNRVDADHRVTGTERQAFVNLRDDAFHVIPGVVGLQAATEGAGQTDRGIALLDHRHALGAVDEVGVGADLGDAGHDLGGQPLAQELNVFKPRAVAEKIFPQFAEGPVPHLLIGTFVDAILNHPGNHIFLIGDDRIVAQIGDGQLAQHVLGSDALLGRFRCDPSEHIAGAELIGLGQDILDVPELISLTEQACG